MGHITQGSSKGGNFLSIVGGKFAKTVDKDTPGAEKRDWSTKDGKSGTKYELIYPDLSGFVKGINFRDTDYGEELSLKMDINGENFIIAMKLKDKFAQDFMQKIPSADLSKELLLAPYSFNNKEGDSVRGLKLIQGDIEGWIKTPFKDRKDFKGVVELKNFFWDGKNNLHGSPNPPKPKEQMRKDDWTIYFIEVSRFLKEKTIAFATKQKVAMEASKTDESSKEPIIVHDDLPF